jgi:exopolysaccharide biosynthesis protein
MKKLLLALIITTLLIAPVHAYNVQDAVGVTQYILGLSQTSDDSWDIDNNGRVDVNDLVLIVKASLEQAPEINITEINQYGYRGWVVTVINLEASVVLANDVLGGRETTPQAASRAGAELAINGGGFNIRGNYHPTQNTIIDGQLITGFEPGGFIGFDTGGRLIGGHVGTESALWEMNPAHGVSFGPTLIQDGVGQSVNSIDRHPRTAIGQLPDGELLIIVIDGRQEGWSRGVTLAELRDLFLCYGATDAYNLDGGGSTTLVYGGKVLNRPSDGQPRVVATNIVFK